METIYTNNIQTQPNIGKHSHKRYMKAKQDPGDPYCTVIEDTHDRFKVRGPITNFCCNFDGDYAETLKRAIQNHCFSNGMANYFFDRELSARQVVFLIEKNKEMLTNSYFALAMRIKLKKINDNKDKACGLDCSLRNEILRQDYEDKEISRLAIKEVKKEVKGKKNEKACKIKDKIKKINLRIQDKKEEGQLNYEDNYTSISELNYQKEILQEKFNIEKDKNKFDELIDGLNGKAQSTTNTDNQSVISSDRSEIQSRISPVKKEKERIVIYDPKECNYSLNEFKKLHRGYKIKVRKEENRGISRKQNNSKNCFVYEEILEGNKSIRFYYHKGNDEEKEKEKVLARNKLNEYLDNVRKLRLGQIKHFDKPLEIKDPDYACYFMPAPPNKKSWFNMFA